VNDAGDAFISHQHMDVSPTSPDVGDNLQMVLGSQSFRDEVQTMIAQQMKVEPVPAANAFLPYAARGCCMIHTSISQSLLAVRRNVRHMEHCQTIDFIVHYDSVQMDVQA